MYQRSIGLLSLVFGIFIPVVTGVNGVLQFVVVWIIAQFACLALLLLVASSIVPPELLPYDAPPFISLDL